MTLIPTFPFYFNQQSLEVFPENICADKYVVFHGTCGFHSPQIESNGFISINPPFDLNVAREIVELTKSETFKGLIDPAPVSRLKEYINKPTRTSLAYLSSACLSFTNGSKKGGQIMEPIRQIRDFLAQHASFYESISNSILTLFNQIDLIDQSPSVIYAVKLSNSLTECSAGMWTTKIIHLDKPLSVTQIIGKVIVPGSFDLTPITEEDIKLKNNVKAITSGIDLRLQQKRLGRF